MIKEEVIINPKNFFAFEKKNELFKIKYKNIFIWDIIRFDVYYKLLWKLKSITPKEQKSFSKLSVLKEISFFIISFFFKKYDIMFFTASRNKNSNGDFFDQNLEDIIIQYPKAVCFESYERNIEKLKNKQITVFNPIIFFRILGRFFYRKIDFTEIVNLIETEFKTSSIENKEINKLIIQFQIDYKFYLLLFRFKKPKVIFITQNGIQKGLFAAATKLMIPVIEVQHGLIDEGHLGYNYNSNIHYKQEQIYLPTYFFSFTEFWFKDLFFPVKEILSMGNSFFYNSSAENIGSENNFNGLLVASSDVFGEDLKKIIIQFSKKMNNIPIYFKLHPNQFAEKQYYINQCLNYPNIKIYTDEYSIYELLAISKSVLGIQSTVLYEALHLKKIAIIYKKQTYYRHRNIFDKKNVFLINGVDDLIKAYNNTYVESIETQNLYFKKFETEFFLKFINNIV